MRVGPRGSFGKGKSFSSVLTSALGARRAIDTQPALLCHAGACGTGSLSVAPATLPHTATRMKMKLLVGDNIVTHFARPPQRRRLASLIASSKDSKDPRKQKIEETGKKVRNPQERTG